MAPERDSTLHTNVLLTNFATTYPLGNPVADFIAPPFKVERPADKYMKYTKSVNRIYDNKVVGREKAKEITWGTTTGTYECEEYELSKFVPDRARRNNDKPINLDFDAVRQLKRAQALSREYRIWALAGSASVVTQTTGLGGDWDTIASGAPIPDILSAMGTIEANTGMMANRIVIPAQVALSMVTTTDWKSYFQYTGQGFQQGLFSAVSGLRQLGLEPMITNMKGLNVYEVGSSDPTDEDIWSDSVLIFYAEQNPTTESRCFMHSPFTFRDKVDSEFVRSEKGTYHYIYEEIDELLVDAACAYLLTNAL